LASWRQLLPPVSLFSVLYGFLFGAGSGCVTLYSIVSKTGWSTATIYCLSIPAAFKSLFLVRICMDVGEHYLNTNCTSI
jgi:hypothetical protein